MQNASYEDTARLTTKEYDVPSVFRAAQAWANVIAGATGRWVVCQTLATRFRLIEVTNSLLGSHVRMV